MRSPHNFKKRIKILFILALIGFALSNCDPPTPSYSLIGPGMLYTPL